jgi:glycosyltransferase involved in cell wall biosynthesis
MQLMLAAIVLLFAERSMSAPHVSVPEQAAPRVIRVLALMEGSTVTGPAKNLFAFAQRAREERAGNLVRAEISIATFQRGPRDQAPNAFISEARARGLEVDVVREQRAFDTGVLRQLHDLVERRRPDILQTHHVKSHFLVRLTGLDRRYPWVAFHHGYTSTSPRVRVYNQLDRWTLPAASRCVTVCGAFAQELSRAGVDAARIAVRHNMVVPSDPVPREEVERVRSSLGIAPGGKLIFCAGRLSREKGHIDLVEAAGLLRYRDGLPPYVALIAGDGPERANLESRIAELGLSRSVILVGHQADLRAWYAAADLAVLPSHTEGSPNMLLEAMCAGLPVVATAVGGTPEIATDGKDALLIAKGDRVNMALAIARLLADEPLSQKLGAEARAVAAKFTPDEYCRSMVELYRGLVDTSRGAASVS